MSNIRYLFCPGSLNYKNSVSKYKKRIQSIDGTWLQSKHYAEIFPDHDDVKINIVKFSEIHTEQADIESMNSWIQNMVLKIYNNIGSTKSSGLLNEFQIRLQKYNLGQKDDIDAIRKEYQLIIQQEPDAKIVVFGSSRGAAAIFSFLSLSSTEEIKNIKSVILEAIPSSIDMVLNHSTGIHFAVLKIASLMLPLITEYKNSNGHPIDFVDGFPRDIPILFVTSEFDRVVPSQSVIDLFIQLKKLQYKNIELLVLQNSDHSNYTTHDDDDTVQYLQASHKYVSLDF